MLGEVGRIGIGLFQTLQVFSGPAAFPAYADVIKSLQPQSFLAHGYRYPHGSLVILEPVAGDPGSSPGKLNIVQNNKNVANVGFIKKSWERSEIRSIGGYNHGFTFACGINKANAQYVIRSWFRRLSPEAFQRPFCLHHHILPGRSRLAGDRRRHISGLKNPHPLRRYDLKCCVQWLSSPTL
jgi:hypothetical protein